MARPISDTSDNVTDIASHRGRGRPKGSTNKKKAAPPAAVAPAAEEDSESEATERAPGFGSNQPDEGVFLRWVNRLNRHEEAGEELKLALKNWRGQRRDLRKEAAAEGLVMGELDEAIEDLVKEHVDLIAREERRRLYHEWLGIPLIEQKPLVEAVSDVEREAAKWFKRGEVDGRQAKKREIPTGCPPEHVPTYLKGHEAGTEVFLRHSPLTAPAFRPEGEKASGQVPAARGPVTFTEIHFQAGTELTDANLKTLLAGHHEAFHNAEEVVAVFGAARRVLKEEGYVDTGDLDVEVTDPEPVGPHERPHGPTAADLA